MMGIMARENIHPARRNNRKLTINHKLMKYLYSVDLEKNSPLAPSPRFDRIFTACNVSQNLSRRGPRDKIAKINMSLLITVAVHPSREKQEIANQVYRCWNI